MGIINEYLKKMGRFVLFLEYYTNEDDMIEFLNREEIEYIKIDWLGSGEFGNAYSLGNGNVIKLTNSEAEFEASGLAKNNPMPGLVKIHERGWYRNEKPKIYYIVMDELELDSKIETMYYSLSSILQTQGLSMSEVSYFDPDEYDGSEGELDGELRQFMDQMETIIHSCQVIGIASPDINPDNLGYNKEGELTLFDIQDQRRMFGRMW